MHGPNLRVSICIHMYMIELTLLIVLFHRVTVGNAAFHSDELYTRLGNSVEPLSHALLDEDEKTRANAAGAVGNLVRNGGLLSQLMADADVVQRLMRIVLTPEAKDSKESSTSQRIALFSLGTMAVYAPTRTRVLSCKQPALLDIMEAIKPTGMHGHDEVMQKYAVRLKQKLKLPLQPHT